MLTDLAQVLPRPGPLWGDYPLRGAGDSAPPWRRLSLSALRTPLQRARSVMCSARAEAAAWQQLAPAARGMALQTLRRRLRRDGLAGAALAQALGVASACAAEQLRQVPRDTQCLAAAVLLDSRLAEMATGEGKTLALALAAAVAALAGIPVHVVTANDYLAARDAAALAPFYQALGLRVTALPAAGDDAARRAAYGHDIVYATAKELAFDFLRDQLSHGTLQPSEQGFAQGLGRSGPPPRLRGLCMALLDEVDSILLDEAEVPLVLSRAVPQAARRAFLWQALALARQLDPARDFTVQADERSARLTPAGEARVAELSASLGGPWKRPRYRREALGVALSGLHACRRDAHYLVRDGAIELLDEVTGRIASGRVWSHGLHTVVALKEGLVPPAETDTVARITFQRFFKRYWRVAGLSGTLREARGELRDVIGSSVVRIPLHAPDRRRTLPPQLFTSVPARWAAVCVRAAELQAAGRPLLVGTDSVHDSLSLSASLLAAGIEHRVLNALHDADEAAIVAGAGRAGQVTVATRMAGRGTDIALDEAARAAGGLHVLSCQANPSRRLDRQLAGRAARHGDPGSTEAWLLRPTSDSEPADPADKLETWKPSNSGYAARLASIALLGQHWTQWCQDRRAAERRRELLQQDQQWERRLSFAGSPA